MYLVDTNVLSELCKPQPNAGVARWANGVKEFFISVVSVEEIFNGLAASPKPRLLAWFEDFFSKATRIVSITEDISRRAGTLRGSLRREGVARSQADMLIAATAISRNLTLVTRNEKDFANLPVTVLNPFS